MLPYFFVMKNLTLLAHITDTNLLESGQVSVYKYSFKLNVKTESIKNGIINKIRKFIIEIHQYNGFSMLKFYPRHLKDNKKKYQLREDKIGYSLPPGAIKSIIINCAELMKDYLTKNPDHFIGYVGQTDERDNREKKRRLTSQRADVYNLLTDTYFKPPKYSASSPNMYKEINLRLIRKIRNKKQEKTLTESQHSNYGNFLNFFKENADLQYEFMTEETRNLYL